MRRDFFPNEVVASLTKAALDALISDPAFATATVQDVISAASSVLVSLIGHIGNNLEAEPQHLFLASVSRELHEIAVAAGRGEYQNTSQAQTTAIH